MGGDFLNISDRLSVLLASIRHIYKYLLILENESTNERVRISEERFPTCRRIFRLPQRLEVVNNPKSASLAATSSATTAREDRMKEMRKMSAYIVLAQPVPWKQRHRSHVCEGPHQDLQ